jgi:hypothetical protein
MAGIPSECYGSLTRFNANLTPISRQFQGSLVNAMASRPLQHVRRTERLGRKGTSQRRGTPLAPAEAAEPRRGERLFREVDEQIVTNLSSLGLMQLTLDKGLGVASAGVRVEFARVGVSGES